ncbi:uncharacterized protein CTRU02_204814 [Colletotrichum truncatum]|uniref:Uncharacterized protein n=1 Tax=Colletotrichum truncatum TaxID=5467 RepID=A0ACC3ZD67_COLTU|nr:uncharacterized protein CTRU02_03048 [Colletotrichum truncatum]KAF6798006.1 hypothetical protein CTRU02_03048 [Colletotrichum truncatum]
MLHSSEAHCADDDWTGLRDRAERRKRQNRLNVRAHRRKKALETSKKQQSQVSIDAGVPWKATQQSGTARSIQILQWVAPGKPIKKDEQEGRNLPKSSTQDEINHFRIRSPVSKSRSKTGFPSKLPFYYDGPQYWFPLCRDHLIPLVYYNVFRATITNIRILSLYSLLGNDCTPDLDTTPLFPAPSQIPCTLLPTALQRSTYHESWIDIFPSGAMRDNAIRYRETIDHHELCADLVGCEDDFDRQEQPGIIAWSDPWHPDGWEVTERFLEKWGFLLKGCEDVMRATNRWRAMRDEEPLVWELE